MTTTDSLTIDREETKSRTAIVGDLIVALRPKRYGRGYDANSAQTRKSTPQCQAAGTYGIGQCEHTGRPETVARLVARGGWRTDTDGWYSVPEQDGAVVLHFCGTHSPARKAAKDAADNADRDFSYRHSAWVRKLSALTQARDGRVKRAENGVLDAARALDESALRAAAVRLRAETEAADREHATKRAALLAEEPTR